MLLHVMLSSIPGYMTHTCVWWTQPSAAMWLLFLQAQGDSGVKLYHSRPAQLSCQHLYVCQFLPICLDYVADQARPANPSLECYVAQGS